MGVEFDEALDLIDIGSCERLAADDLGAGEGFFAAAIELDGEIIRLLDPELLIGREEAAEMEDDPRPT